MGRIRMIMATALVFCFGICFMYADGKITEKDVCILENKLQNLELTINVAIDGKRIDVFGTLKNNTDEEIFVPKYYITFFDSGELNRDCFIIKDLDSGNRIKANLRDLVKLSVIGVWKRSISLKPGEEISIHAKNIQINYPLDNIKNFVIQLSVNGLLSNPVEVNGY